MATSMTPFAESGSLNGTTTVTPVSAGAGEKYVLRMVNIDNVDTATKTIEFRHTRGGTSVKFLSSTVSSGGNRLTDVLNVVLDGDQSDQLDLVMTAAATTTNPTYLVGGALYE